MAYKITNWEYSDAVVVDVEVPEGLRVIHIDNAEYDDEQFTFKVDCTDLETEARFILRYWLKTTDPKTGTTSNNASAIGTLNSLGRAIFGDDSNVGVPCPCDIVGAVCVANIKLKESGTSGKKYPRCYNFMSASQSEAWASGIEQYFRP